MTIDPANEAAPAEDGSEHMASTPAADPLVAALAAGVAEYRVQRVPLQQLRALFAQLDPTGASSSEARIRLATALDALAADGVVTLPRSRRLYESHLSPPLPVWVERPAVPRPTRAAAPARVWRPELARAAEAASTVPDYEVLSQVDEFLRNDGAQRPVVPHRERSVELFANEKRLDALLRTKLFTTGALSLELLRCYRAPLPLTAQHTGDPGPVPQLLIVENHATYASLLDLARARAASGEPAIAVGYGAGNQLPKAIGGITQLTPVPARVWYFGDLDEDGLKIARDVGAAAFQAGLPALQPALPLYRALLGHGARQPGNRPVDHEAARYLTSWLVDEQVQSAAVEVLVAGRRIAQESIGYERLAQMASWW